MDEQRLGKLIADLNQQWVMAAEHRLDSKSYVRQALEDVFELSVAYQAVEGGAKPEVLAEIAQSAALARANFDLVERLVAGEVRKANVTWQHEEWETWKTLCMLRSQLEFMKLLYREVIPAEKFNSEDLRWLDSTLEDNCGSGYLPDEFVPYGVPPSHYWWWLPESPPPV